MYMKSDSKLSLIHKELSSLTLKEIKADITLRTSAEDNKKVVYLCNSRVDRMEAKVADLEDRNRRNNLRLIGLPEGSEAKKASDLSDWLMAPFTTYKFSLKICTSGGCAEDSLRDILCGMPGSAHDAAAFQSSILYMGQHALPQGTSSSPGMGASLWRVTWTVHRLYPDGGSILASARRGNNWVSANINCKCVGCRSLSNALQEPREHPHGFLMLLLLCHAPRASHADGDALPAETGRVAVVSGIASVVSPVGSTACILLLKSVVVMDEQCKDCECAVSSTDSSSSVSSSGCSTSVPSESIRSPVQLAVV
ncbi:hypothetical protein EOD39_7935 [Acipenser ruthenus]|uniref:Uncharacterized protein n=1 Tax=Acipenser ruthenus TaxID=7906 RepID=A0A444U5J0_ACIRT|nr:hypothetical protein EOD39_7935 [Acipenser ruthenus]